jgi:adenylosuccinate synthase
MNKIYDSLLEVAPIFKPMMTDVSLRLQEHWREGKTILFEGAQGAMLDIDLGTYPFTTSSNTTTGGALTGLGITPKMIDEVIGVVKAYTTRVGTGPFPTELVDETGENFRNIGGEYGATTGRPRRTGWLDLVALRHACRINGIEKIAVTKLDVLDRFETIKICIGYNLNGSTLKELPLDSSDLWTVQPIYREFKGWKTPTAGITSLAKLPLEARQYLEFMASDLGVEICLISTGASRKETIVVQ